MVSSRSPARPSPSSPPIPLEIFQQQVLSRPQSPIAQLASLTNWSPSPPQFRVSKITLDHVLPLPFRGLRSFSRSSNNRSIHSRNPQSRTVPLLSSGVPRRRRQRSTL
nr:PREDICTED: uncharacterized protein LOC108951560 [Musa acuminata subsp. malaccensis]